MVYLVPLVLIAAGLFLLIWGAENIIRAAPTATHKMNISPIAAGAIILGIGTSLPEVMVSLVAGLRGESVIAYGNAVGSNIANIGLILGITALISPIVFISKVVRRQFLLMGAATVLFLVLTLNLRLLLWDALLLLALLVVSVWLILQSKTMEKPDETMLSNRELALRLIGGFGGIFIGGPITVQGVSTLATNLGVPTQLVSLSLLAVGTSLPEMVVSIQVARKKKPQLVIGNILGSQIFNLLLVVPIACIFHPIVIRTVDLKRDGGFLIALTALLFLICFSWNGKRTLRIGGALLMLLIYFLYIGVIVAPIF